jgi:dephospho-CoA kinase
MTSAWATAPTLMLAGRVGYLGREVPPSRVLVVPYDDAWPARASALIGRLRSSLGASALRIEHIGSTAISGMAAKDVIDLQVSVADLDAATERFDAPLQAEGFTRLPYDRDHAPTFVDDEPARWAKRFWSRRGHPDGDVNLHVRLAGAPNERLALLFRDWLRAHPAAVPAYASFKLALAQAVPDLYAYTEIKDPVVDLLITVAEPWALENGWTP